MRRIIFAGLVSITSFVANAQVLTDQNNDFIHSLDGAFCSLQASANCGQSFQQSHTNIAGAGISIREFQFVVGAQVTISIFSSYGTTPAGLVASGTSITSSPGWIDVFWDAAAVDLSTTYFLVVESPVENLAAHESGFDTYSLGHAHLQGSLEQHSTSDLAFRTYFDDAASVPEPSTFGLLGLGLAGFGLLRRKQPLEDAHQVSSNTASGL